MVLAHMLGKVVEDKAVAEAVGSLGRHIEDSLEAVVAHNLGVNVVDSLAAQIGDLDNLVLKAVVMALCWEVVGTL